ncbi:hypothetical protein [Halosolutus halophilus]|uniref:hypothetical protein n=1 Tax=Halosolutus halophilus TaxID=1552990 RepID=UPI0022351F77|nr:hypothetical protein [Halosolutus halophilus]
MAPATGYELSLYAGTSIQFWMLFASTVVVSVIAALRATTTWDRGVALVLGGGAAAVFVGLPVLRGYRFYGTGDALTHLGWMRGIEAGAFAPVALEYPALHTLAVFLSATLEVDLTRAAMLVIVLLACLFVLFVALSIGTVFDSRYSTTVGTFSALLFLPITTLSTFMVPHAMSQAILFSSIVFYLFLRYVRDPDSLARRSATGLGLSIALIALVVYHPQLAAHLLVALFSVCALQVLYRRFRSNHPIANHRSIFGQIVVLAGAFLVWTSNHGFFTGVIEYAASSAAAYFLADGSAGESVNSQSASLSELGASVVELFLKLFAPSLVFIALVGFVVLWTVFERDGAMTRETEGLLPYFTVSLCGLSGVFALYYLGSYGTMYFRVLGLMLLLVTIVGAVAISAVITGLSRRVPTGLVHGAAVVAFGLLILFSLIAVFPSPYIYSASPHVTEMSMSGHETAFENQDPEVSFAGIRAGPNRYADASNGELERTRHYEGVSGEEIDEGLAGQYSDDRYLTVTRTDREREVRAFQELRYTESQLDSISSQSDVNRVQSNGEFELYYVRGQAE